MVDQLLRADPELLHLLDKRRERFAEKLFSPRLHDKLARIGRQIVAHAAPGEYDALRLKGFVGFHDCMRVDHELRSHLSDRWRPTFGLPEIGKDAAIAKVNDLPVDRFVIVKIHSQSGSELDFFK